MADEILPYTTNDDFNEIKDKDETLELVAYVDEVHVPAIVGKVKKFDLFKFMINNGGNKRMVCLVWGKKLIDKYVGDITVGKIVHIERGVAKAVTSTYYKETQNLINFELLIKEPTTIAYLGQHNFDGNTIDVPNGRDIPDVTFENIGKSEGFVRIEGYVKSEFFKNENYKGETYGCGAITDGIYKVIVHVKNFDTINLQKGVRIKVVGEVDNDVEGTITIVCRDDNSIAEVDGVIPMTPAKLVRGVKTPKRGRE